MKKKKIAILLAAGAMTLNTTNATMVLAAESTTEQSVSETDGDSEVAVFAEDGTPVTKTVKAYEISFPVQDSY